MCVTTYTATLELKAEKANAHSAAISSVAYSPDGSQILTGSYDKSLKVWDAANPRPHNEAEWEEIEGAMPGARNLFGQPDTKVIHYWKNIVTGHVQKGKPSGAGEKAVVQHEMAPSMPGSGSQVPAKNSNMMLQHRPRD